MADVAIGHGGGSSGPHVFAEEGCTQEAEAAEAEAAEAEELRLLQRWLLRLELTGKCIRLMRMQA